MIVDFLIELYKGLLTMATGFLPLGDTTMQTAPPLVSSFTAVLWFYVDPTPLQVLFSLLSSLLIGFIIFKAINMVFTWIRQAI